MKKLLYLIGLLLFLATACNRAPGSQPEQNPAENNVATSILEENTNAHALTDYVGVAGYIRENQKLPSNYITKSQARALGWDAHDGNLNEVAPGKSIGGDVFRNAERKLPNKKGRVWYEADINYHGGFRGSERLIFSNDGLIYKTSDHYKTFSQIK